MLCAVPSPVIPPNTADKELITIKCSPPLSHKIEISLCFCSVLCIQVNLPVGLRSFWPQNDLLLAGLPHSLAQSSKHLCFKNQHYITDTEANFSSLFFFTTTLSQDKLLEVLACLSQLGICLPVRAESSDSYACSMLQTSWLHTEL